VGKFAKVGLFLSLVIGFTTVAPVGAFAWNGPCDVDNSVKSFAKLNTWSKQTNMCVGPVKVKKAYSVPGAPKSSISPESDLLSAEVCKISDGQRSGVRAFPKYQIDAPHPSASTRYLFLPFISEDLPQKQSPWSGYSQYFNFLKDWMSYINESDAKQQFTFQRTAVKLPFSVGPYKINHDNDKDGATSNKAFGRKFIAEVDSKIDFSKFDVVLVMPPAGSPRGVFELGFLGTHTVDGNRVVFMSVPPATYTTQFVPHFPMITPLNWMHELHHAGGYTLQHHTGNDYWQNNRGSNPNFPGLGEWGLMNHSKTDLLGWEKWFIGYTKDSQVSCIDPAKQTKVWLRPSGIRTDAKKLAVIPISSTKVVVLESMRAVGLNYKLGKASQGLLVWTVDTTDPRESYGVEMVTPSNRILTKTPFVYYDAPLKKGEQVKVEGLTIKVIEAGKYGDVFSVSSSN
jgi:hypothetical protein